MARSEKRRSTTSLVFFLLGVACIVPIATGISDEDWTIPVAFIGLIVALTALICFFMFNKRAKVESEDFTETNLLADWKLDDGSLKVYTKGMISDGEMYLWNSMETTLEAVGRNPFEPGKLIILYRMLAGRRLAKRRHVLEVTIPEGQNETADKLIAYYNLPLPEDYINRLKEEIGINSENDEEMEDDN